MKIKIEISLGKFEDHELGDIDFEAAFKYSIETGFAMRNDHRDFVRNFVLSDGFETRKFQVDKKGNGDIVVWNPGDNRPLKFRYFVYSKSARSYFERAPIVGERGFESAV